MQRFLSLTAPQPHREELRSDGVQTESPEHSAALSPPTGSQRFDPPSYQHAVSALVHRDTAQAEQQLAFASAEVALQAVPESDEPAASSLDDGYLLMQSLVEPVAQEPRAETGTAIELEPLAPTIVVSN